MKSKEFDENRLILLQTRMENAIGFREHYLIEAERTGNRIMFEYWDTELDWVINEIINFGREQ